MREYARYLAESSPTVIARADPTLLNMTASPRSTTQRGALHATLTRQHTHRARRLRRIRTPPITRRESSGRHEHRDGVLARGSRSGHDRGAREIHPLIFSRRGRGATRRECGADARVSTRRVLPRDDIPRRLGVDRSIARRAWGRRAARRRAERASGRLPAERRAGFFSPRRWTGEMNDARPLADPSRASPVLRPPPQAQTTRRPVRSAASARVPARRAANAHRASRSSFASGANGARAFFFRFRANDRRRRRSSIERSIPRRGSARGLTLATRRGVR